MRACTSALSQDFAGVGGDARYIRTVGDARYYQPILPDSDIVGMLRVSGGNITGLGQPVAIADNFFKGGETIRGFAPLGYGPRDTTAGATGAGIAVGGKNFVAGTAEVHVPAADDAARFRPARRGLRRRRHAVRRRQPPASRRAPIVDDMAIRSSVGGSIIWASPFGAIRADFAQALTKQSYDKTQIFRLGAGTSF